VKGRTLHLLADFVRVADLQIGPVVLATRHGSWQANIRGKPNAWYIPGVPAALFSALQLVPGQTVCMTVLCPGRLLITAEGDQQFIATSEVAAAERAAERAAKAAARNAARAAAAERAARAAAEALLPPASESELEADVSRVSSLKVCPWTKPPRGGGGDAP
jgi:hypothetical protein